MKRVACSLAARDARVAPCNSQQDEWDEDGSGVSAKRAFSQAATLMLSELDLAPGLAEVHAVFDAMDSDGFGELQHSLALLLLSS